MALPDFSMRSLLEAGAHFGHQSHRWNPKMAPYIFGTRNNIHILDLAQTVPMLHQALQGDLRHRGPGRPRAVRRHQAPGLRGHRRRGAPLGAVLRQRPLARRHADELEDHFGSIQRLRKVDELLAAGAAGLTKKERLMLSREKEKLDRALGGIKDMGGTPDLIFVIDTNKEQLAIQEAKRLGIPVAAIIDSNCDPDGITYPVPGNDDAGRAIALYCDLVARAAIDGISRGQGSMGVDIGRERGSDRRGAVLPKSPARPPARLSSCSTAPRGAPDDLSKFSSMSPLHREEAERRRHLPLLADRRHGPGRRRPDRHRRQAGRPHRPRGLGRPGARLPRKRLSCGSDRAPAGSAPADAARIRNCSAAAAHGPPSRPFGGPRAAASRHRPRGLNHGHDHRRTGEGTAREDRRGHDGLQGRARGE